VAAALVGAVTLTACGGDDSEDDATPAPSASASSSASVSPSASASASASAPAGELEGSWLATTGGESVVLMINDGEAGLFATRGTVCSGRVEEASGASTIRLNCTEGTDERGTGTVDSVSDASLEVTWDGGLGQETYTKAEGGTMPSGLPTSGLGTG
jgi:hypothetical protein